MKTTDKASPSIADGKETFTLMSRDTISRREFLIGSAAVAVTIFLSGVLFGAPDGKKTFTILHTKRHALELHWHGSGRGLYPIQAQRRYDERAREVRAIKIG
jgi:hypothetical protein